MRWHRYIGVWIFGSIFSEIDRKTDNRPESAAASRWFFTPAAVLGPRSMAGWVPTREKISSTLRALPGTLLFAVLKAKYPRLHATQSNLYGFVPGGC